MTTNNNCPCGSGSDYESCCKIYIDNNSNDYLMAPDAQILMRSRFTAFVLKDADYLVATKSETPPTAEQLMASFDDQQWVKLTVIKHDIEPNQQWVEFAATFYSDGKYGTLHEKSRFSNESGHWQYKDGKLITQGQRKFDLPDRNAPCWCGSGKKFKKCHG